MFAAGHRKVAGSTASISRRLNGRVSEATLQSLNHAGFIEIIASKELAKRLQIASPEEETERELDKNPLTPLEGGTDEVATQRARGTNPRAKTKAAKRQQTFVDFLKRVWDEYPDPEILIVELTDRGCRRDEAEDLVAQERARREVAA
jgi:hypothetical protein